MNLLVRINLSLAVIFLLGAFAASIAYRSLLQASAKRDMLAQAELMMNSAQAIRDYEANRDVASRQRE